MRNIALKLMYNGTAYHGWQVQKNAVTVCGTLEKAIAAICGGPVHLTGCGRTDAGVHAEHYIANFRTESRIPLDRLPFAINTHTPEDIAVKEAFEVAEDFNAIGSCIKKEYTYRIYNSRFKNPFYVNRAYFYPKRLDEDFLDRAAGMFVGTHDFAAVRSVGTETKSTVRTIHYCNVTRNGDLLELKVCADGFLYNMVRAITGTRALRGGGQVRPGGHPRHPGAGGTGLPPAPRCRRADCISQDFGMRMGGSMADKTNDIWNDNDGEEEAPAKRGRLRRFLLFALVLLAVLGVVVVAAWRDGTGFDALRRLFAYGGADEAAGEVFYEYDESDSNRFAALGDALVVLSDTKLQVLGADGQEVWSVSVRIGGSRSGERRRPGCGLRRGRHGAVRGGRGGGGGLPDRAGGLPLPLRPAQRRGLAGSDRRPGGAQGRRHRLR